jgi:hypothetical protein
MEQKIVGSNALRVPFQAIKVKIIKLSAMVMSCNCLSASIVLPVIDAVRAINIKYKGG